MCGRFSQSERIDRVAELFGAEPDPGLPDASWNVAPTDPIRIIVERDERRTLTTARWGFRPFWREDTRDGARNLTRAPAQGWINAKAETAIESPAFGRALRSDRCIIPADAFYEWDRGQSPSQPYAIGPAGETAVLGLAGIWTRANDGAPTAAILTIGPNEVMRRLHHRMPVIIGLEEADAWLAPDAAIGEIASLLRPAPDDTLRVWPVSRAVNSVRNNGPHLLRPADAVPETLGLL